MVPINKIDKTLNRVRLRLTKIPCNKYHLLSPDFELIAAKSNFGRITLAHQDSVVYRHQNTSLRKVSFDNLRDCYEDCASRALLSKPVLVGERRGFL